VITICPQCQLSLAVSAADLRVAQGHVRCGRCASVFNALVSLYESETEALAPQPTAEPAIGTAPGEQTEAAIEAAAGATQSRILAVTIDTDATGAGANTGVFEAGDLPPAATIDSAATTTGPSQQEAALEQPALGWLPAANDPGVEEVVAANDPIADAEAIGIRAPSLESIERLDIDLGALPPTTDDWNVVPQLQPAGADSIDLAEPEVGQTRDADAGLIPIYDLDADRDVPPERAESTDSAEPSPRPAVPPQDDAPLDELVAAEEPPRHARLWAAGSALLGLLLAGQWIHHQREALVAWPALTEPLTRLYAAIGRPIRLRGDLGAYDVRQLGAVAAADAPGTLTVRASLRNVSPRPQPMPLLRVTLQDRYGNRIASRDLTAAEYQQRPAGTAPTQLLAAGARLETAVQLVDPGGSAVGFELDVCLAEGGATRCASDIVAANRR
jgi:predicted Zn finger-like uncharacterized protein